MSSYLVSLVISDFECLYGEAKAGISGKIDVRMCGRPEVFRKLHSALKHTIKQLEIQEKYFGIEYPFTKLGTF